MPFAPPGYHLAALFKEKGIPLSVGSLPTPQPGKGELLIAVKAIAINPIDHSQRDYGMPPVKHIPAVLGSDVSGVVVGVGPKVSATSPKLGDKVAAFCPAYFCQGLPPYGAFQTHCLVPAGNACRIPSNFTFSESAVLPMSVNTALIGFYFQLGIPRDLNFKAGKGKGMLIWGASSSNGSAAVQIAKGSGFVVYTTAGERNHEYVKRTFGVANVYDHRDGSVVDKIIAKAKRDGVTIDLGYDAVGAMQQCLDVLRALKSGERAKLASAIPLKDTDPNVEGVDVEFINVPVDPEVRNKQFEWAMQQYLERKLTSGDFVPSPRIKLLPGGLEGINAALDELRNGVSATKLVLEI